MRKSTKAGLLSSFIAECDATAAQIKKLVKTHSNMPFDDLAPVLWEVLTNLREGLLTLENLSENEAISTKKKSKNSNN